jgi:hypothetical protein
MATLFWRVLVSLRVFGEYTLYFKIKVSFRFVGVILLVYPIVQAFTISVQSVRNILQQYLTTKLTEQSQRRRIACVQL